MSLSDFPIVSKTFSSLVVVFVGSVAIRQRAYNVFKSQPRKCCCAMGILQRVLRCAFAGIVTSSLSPPHQGPCCPTPPSFRRSASWVIRWTPGSTGNFPNRFSNSRSRGVSQACSTLLDECARACFERALLFMSCCLA